VKEGEKGGGDKGKEGNVEEKGKVRM